MSKVEFIVRYDGPALADHKMDVERVAPAMLALAELVKRANELANGDRASVKVLLTANVEQHCFELVIEIVQTAYEALKTLLKDDDIKTAKELAEWLGILCLASGAGGLGLFGILRLLRGRKPDSVNMIVRDGRNVTQINVGGDVYFGHPNLGQLLQDPESIKPAKAVVSPATEEGYESISFRVGDKETERITNEEARLIQSAPEPGAKVVDTLPVGRLRAWVKIRKAVYDGVGKWTIQYDKSRDVSINDKDWLQKFQSNKISAPPKSMLDVDMSIGKVELDENGHAIREPEFAIEKVHDVKLPAQASDLFNGSQPTKPEQS